MLPSTALKPLASGEVSLFNVYGMPLGFSVCYSVVYILVAFVRIEWVWTLKFT